MITALPGLSHFPKDFYPQYSLEFITSTKSADAISLSPRLIGYVETLRLEVALVAKWSDGDLVLDTDIVAGIVPKLRKLALKR